LSRKVYKDFEVGVNYNYAEFNLTNQDPSFEAGLQNTEQKLLSETKNYLKLWFQC
jgi:hypothetical protein